MHLSFPSLFIALKSRISRNFSLFKERFFPPLPKFLQYIAVIHFTVPEEQFFSAVYTLPSPRTGAIFCSKYSQKNAPFFSISSRRFKWNYHIDFSAKIEVS